MPGREVCVTEIPPGPSPLKCSSAVTATVAGHCPCFHRMQNILLVVAGSQLEYGALIGKHPPIDWRRVVFKGSRANAVRNPVVDRCGTRPATREAASFTVVDGCLRGLAGIRQPGC